MNSWTRRQFVVRTSKTGLYSMLVCVAVLLPVAHATAAVPSQSELQTNGAYLAAAGNCVSCHTRPGGEPFAGGLPFHTPFGTVYSTNITPHRARGIGAWTEQDFMRAMRAGIRKDGEHLYPVFPYADFTKVSDADIKALWAYLQSLQVSEYRPPANDLRFPFGRRFLIGGWKALYFTPGRFVPDPAQSAQWNRGAYLIEGLGHCGACHTPRSFLGGEKDAEAMTGGVHSAEVMPETVRKWSSPNLTQASSGLAAWSTDDIAAYLKTGHNARAGTFGPMNEVIVNSTSRLSSGDVQAMAIYLKSLPARSTTATHRPDPEAQAAGENLYTIHCGTCHLPTGAGDAKTGPPLAASAVVQAPDAATLINVILYGAQVPSPAPDHAWKSMEGYEAKLSDEEVADLANYLRTSFGNQGGRVDPDEVAAQR